MLFLLRSAVCFMQYYKILACGMLRAEWQCVLQRSTWRDRVSGQGKNINERKKVLTNRSLCISVLFR